MSRTITWLAIILLGCGAVSQAWAQHNDLFEKAPWSASLGLGMTKFEGDEPVKDGFQVSLKLGYDYSPRWTLEGGLDIMPSLQNRTFEDGRHALSNSIFALRLTADILFHLRNTQDMRFDPYVSLGGALHFYEEELYDKSVEPGVFAGAGLFYHFDDVWALRGDFRAGWAGTTHSEFNMIFNVGANYRWGAHVPAAYQLAGGDIDSDGDGLLDSEEAKIGTDPYNPDTDGDGLSDGQEVHGVDFNGTTITTDPLNPDSDWDGLKDGPEALTYKTNPMDRDTDKGGVADGHEVIEDNTDPLNPADDLQLFTLNIEFDYDKADLRPIYFDKLDVIVKVLQRDPGATARVEGHADKRKTSEYNYNIKLSERRAKAVVDYLVDVGGIDRARLTYKGYGYTRPVAPNDTEENMQKNRRTEIYIRPSGQPEGPVVIMQHGTDSAEPVVAPAPEAAAPAEAPMEDTGIK